VSSDLAKKHKVTIVSENSLHSRLQQKKVLEEVAKIGAQQMPNRILLLLDFSGSMDTHAGADETRLSLTEKATQAFVTQIDSSNTTVALQSFPDYLNTELTNDKTQLWLMTQSFSTCGDTPLCSALRAKVQEDITRVIIISDGEPTDGDPTYDTEMGSETGSSIVSLYAGKKIPIDCIHISNSTSGEDLMKRIAKLTGGHYIKFRSISNMVEAMSYLLPQNRGVLGLPEARKLLKADELI
jgi:hypothetical protein